jgi:hypothetical protein
VPNHLAKGILMAGKRKPSMAAMALAVLVSSSTLIVGAGGAEGTATHLTSAAAAARQGGGTVVRHVTPLNASGHLRPPYTVNATARGSCWTASFVNGRAYRCFQRSTIMDPCWKEHGRRSVVCLLRPWVKEVTRLRLTRRLPATAGERRALWGLRLGSGIRVNCLISTGAGGWIGNRHISYYCRQGWVLLNKPNRQHAVWTISTAKRVRGRYELRGRKSLIMAWVPIVRS